MKPAGTGGHGANSKLAIVVLADGQHRPVLRAGPGNRCHAVVRPRSQVHDHAIDPGQGIHEGRCGTDRHRGRPGGAHQVDQPGGPDEVVGQDRDPLCQVRVSAR